MHIVEQLAQGRQPLPHEAARLTLNPWRLALNRWPLALKPLRQR